MYDLLEALEDELPDRKALLSVIPAREMLSSPDDQGSVRTHGRPRSLWRRTTGPARLSLPGHRHAHPSLFGTHLKSNALLITPGDRSDVILSALQAHQSQNYPKVAGLLLTGGLNPPDSVDLLLSGLSDIIPIITVQTDTYQTAMNIGNVRSYITADNQAKIKLSLRLFERHVDTVALEKQLSTLPDQGITPKMFIYNLVQQAKSDKKHIVLPEGTDERILRAAASLRRNNMSST